MFNTEMLQMGANINFGNIADPKNAEEYAKMDSISKFTLRLKWSFEEYNGGDSVADKLRKYDLQPIIEKYWLIDKQSNQIKVLDKHELTMEDKEVRYLIRYANEQLKNPKYKTWYKYKIEKHTYRLKGNEYILIQ